MSIQGLSNTSLKTELRWSNVGVGFTFVLFDAIISYVFGLGLGRALIVGGLRCIVQLSLMALVLQQIFDARDPWGVAGISCLLNLLGTFEVVLNEADKRYHRMFAVVFFSMICSSIPVAIIGTRYAMSVVPFWTPDQYIPVVGMLCGNTISAIVVCISFILKEIHENKDKIMTYLAFGASRFEACRPVAKEALRLALASPISQMSVIGAISIPGMMTGAIFGGVSVEQAALLQMVLMFMIVASTALAAILATYLTLAIVIDSEHRLRADLIIVKKHVVWRIRDRCGELILAVIWRLYIKTTNKLYKFRLLGKRNEDSETLQGMLDYELLNR